MHDRCSERRSMMHQSSQRRKVANGSTGAGSGNWRARPAGGRGADRGGAAGPARAPAGAGGQHAADAGPGAADRGGAGAGRAPPGRGGPAAPRRSGNGQAGRRAAGGARPAAQRATGGRRAPGRRTVRRRSSGAPRRGRARRASRRGRAGRARGQPRPLDRQPLLWCGPQRGRDRDRAIRLLAATTGAWVNRARMRKFSTRRRGLLVVVAGGAGFLGANLVDRLQAEGDEVVVVDDLSHGNLANLTEARRRGGVRFHRMDVTQGGLAVLAERIHADAWVHLAMSADSVRIWVEPSADGRQVVTGAVEVLQAAATGGAKVVLASSGAYLYPGQLTGVTRPDDRPAPVHPLGAGRLALEAYANAFAARGLDSAVLLFGTVYGPRQDPLGPSLVSRTAWSMLQEHAPRVEGDGRQERDFLFVDDAVDALARAVHTDASGRMLIGWSGEPEWAPPRPGDPRRCALDPDRAGKVLGWQPWTSLEEGLAITAEWLTARLPRK